MMFAYIIPLLFDFMCTGECVLHISLKISAKPNDLDLNNF